MNETPPALPLTPTESTHSLIRAVEADAAGLTGALLQTLDRLNLLVAVKEIATGRYVHANERMADLFDRTPAQLVGATDADWLRPAEAAPIRIADQAVLADAAFASASGCAPTPRLSEHHFERDGRQRDFSVTRIALPRADGAVPRHLLAVWTELTSAHRRDAQLQQALVQLEQTQLAAEVVRRETQDPSMRESVTGLFQQAHFNDQLRREVDLSSRELREFALVAIALDPPTEAVAALGPEARARVLEALGRLLRGNTRPMDAACRVAEDRVAVLLSGIGLATAHSRMEGLRRQCATQIVMLGGRDLGFTVSMGVASFPHTARTEQELLQAAEQALEEAQKRGGNQIALASIRFEPGSAGASGPDEAG